MCYHIFGYRYTALRNLNKMIHAEIYFFIFIPEMELSFKPDISDGTDFFATNLNPNRCGKITHFEAGQWYQLNFVKTFITQ